MEIGNLSKAPPDSGANYTIRYIASQGHFQLGNAIGKLLWEPFKWANPANAYTGAATAIRSVRISPNPMRLLK